MESYEGRHSDFGLTSRIAKLLGVTKPPLRMDSQVKYGAHLSRNRSTILQHFVEGGQLGHGLFVKNAGMKSLRLSDVYESTRFSWPLQA